MWSGLLVRFPTPHDSERATVAARVEICPPSSRPGWAERLRAWLAKGWGEPPFRRIDDGTALPGVATPLATVRREFVASLGDVATRQAAHLAERIEVARSLRELWHLRAEIFSIVSCHVDQAEARMRMSRLNRHFPARAPRSGFGGFDAEPRSNLHG